MNPRMLFILLALPAWIGTSGCTEYGMKVCAPCEPGNPLKACEAGLECVDSMCVRPGGNHAGECCDNGPAECGDAFFCVYQTCAESPIYPPPKEDVETLSDPFTVTPDTRVILPADPTPTDQTAGEILQTQIEESLGLQLAVQSYEEGISLDNAIVVGTETSNPGVQALSNQLGLVVPADGPNPNENYAFAVAQGHIVVAGRGDTGALFGTQALKQLIRGETEKSPSAVLNPRVVRDYPDAEQRMFILLLMIYCVPTDDDGDGTRDPYKYTDIPVDLNIARAYLHHLSEFRFNTVLFSLADIVTWANLPQPQNTAMSVSELMDLVTEANRYGLEVIPFLTGSSSSHGWIGTEENPVEYTQEYSIAHGEENLAVYTDLLQEIVDAFAPVQPLHSFHIGMDEDTTFGPRSWDMHRQWVNEAYDVLTANGVHPIIWHDIWTQTPDFIQDYANYPDMHVAVWDYHTFIANEVYAKIDDIIAKGMEVSQAFMDNGLSRDFEHWFSDSSPLRKGFIGVYWSRQGTTCRQDAFDYLLPTYIRRDADKFWNARTY